MSVSCTAHFLGLDPDIPAVVETLGLHYNSTGLCNHLFSERNMTSCSENHSIIDKQPRAHIPKISGGGVPNFSGPTFMVQYPLKPTCPLFYKKLLVYCLTDYNLKIINKCIGAGTAPFVHAIRKRHRSRSFGI
jgi:hypothetical protein